MLVTSGHEGGRIGQRWLRRGALFDVGLEILDNGVPQYHKYGISDDEAFRRRTDLRRDHRGLR